MYVGESNGKKIARLRYWTEVRAQLGERFYTKKHVTLASQNGGDVAVLLGLGVDKSRIVAVDRRRDAVEECRRRWPGVRVLYGDALTVIDDERKHLGSAFLDFCGVVGSEVGRTIRVASGMLRDGSILGAAVQYGRENDRATALPSTATGTRRGRRLVKAMMRSRSPAAREFAGHVRAIDDALQATNEARARLRAMGYQIDDLGGSGLDVCDGRNIRPLQEIRATRAGSPDVPPSAIRASFIYGYMTSRATPVRTIAYRGNSVPMVICCARLERVGLERVGSHADAARLEIETVDADRDSLRSLALEMDAPALLLNIPAATIAAWRAHATRGTYDQSAP